LKREAGLGRVEYVYLIRDNGIDGKGRVIWMRQLKTTCPWKATVTNLGPAALFRTFRADVEFCRIRSHGVGGMDQVLPLQIYRALFIVSRCQPPLSVILRNSAWKFRTPIGIPTVSYLHVKSDTSCRPSGSGDLVAWVIRDDPRSCSRGPA
jgi:hypothetical protein